LLKPNWNAHEFRKLIDNYEATLPDWAWPNFVLGNHDESRIATRYGQEQARVAAMLLLTLRGTPTIYYGEELGMTNVDILPDEQLDPFGFRILGWGRDRCRTPMQWDSGPYAGFSPADTRKLWLPISGHYKTDNVAQELKDPHSMLNLYRALFALRKKSLALCTGTYTPIDSVPENCFVYLREVQDEKILIALNFSSELQTISLPGYTTATALISTYLDRNEDINFSELELRNDEGIILKLT